jgi:hypothetical protein
MKMPFSLDRAVLCLAAVILPLAASQAEMPAFRHDRLNIFPAGAVAASGRAIAVDGDLADWNPAAFVTMAADLDNKPRYAMQVAAAYDDQGILLAVRFTDDTPLVNRVDPIGQPDKGWAGDSFQIRFITDPRIGTGVLRTDIQKDPEKNSRVVHMTLWQNSDAKLPAAHVAYGWDFKNQQVLTGNESLFRFAPADGGYAMEGRIPWKLLHVATPPQPGTDWVMTVQGNWSGGGVNDLGHSFYDLVCAAGFPYQTSAAWGRGHFVEPGAVAATLAKQQADEQKLWAAPVAAAPAVSIPLPMARSSAPCWRGPNGRPASRRRSGTASTTTGSRCRRAATRSARSPTPGSRRGLSPACTTAARRHGRRKTAAAA